MMLIVLVILLAGGLLWAQAPSSVDAVAKGLDILSQKDLLWMAEAVALGCVGLIFWLVRLIVKIQADSIVAITTLCNELKNRPCQMVKKTDQ